MTRQVKPEEMPPKSPYAKILQIDFRANIILSHSTHPIVGFMAHLGLINQSIFDYIN